MLVIMLAAVHHVVVSLFPISELVLPSRRITGSSLLGYNPINNDVGKSDLLLQSCLVVV